MKVVGIDFGTSNVRVSTWDPDTPEVPETHIIGAGDLQYMPAVVALHLRSRDKVDIVIGEDADGSVDIPHNTLVIRNIKRYALSDDDYVNWHLDVRSTQGEATKWPPEWLDADEAVWAWYDPEKRCVQAFNQEFPLWKLIGYVLGEALRRAREVGNFNAKFEWRAGCPVHAGLDYRHSLAATLQELSGTGDANCVVEEPVLLMTLAHRAGDVSPGSYLVYDFGGGSFDCAVVEIMEIDDDRRMVVYGADGHPLLGGADIDQRLADRKGYTGQLDQLRQAKESLGSGAPSAIAGGVEFIQFDWETVLRAGGFLDKSLMSLHDSYVAAKVLWKRSQGKDDPPIGEIATRNRETGGVGFVWQFKWDGMVDDLDGIIMFGGTTKAVHFYEGVSMRFPGANVKTTYEVFPELRGEPALELTAVSKGACYAYEERHSPLYHSRLPVRASLEDLETGEKLEYEPFEYFADKRLQHPTQKFKPFGEFVSNAIVRQEALIRSVLYPQRYRLTVAYPNEVVLKDAFLDDLLDTHFMNYTLRLVIDRYGRIGVEQKQYDPDDGMVGEAAEPKPALGPLRAHMVLDDTPWQTGDQREALQKLFDQERRYAEEMKLRGLRFFMGFPWQYPTP